LAALTITAQKRQSVLRVTSEVLEVAPWFELSPSPAETTDGRFRWRNLLPATWPNHGWEPTAGGAGVVCRGTPHLGAETINGLLGVVDQTAGWALCCALTLATAPVAP
jgi:hypothetical protein